MCITLTKEHLENVAAHLRAEGLIEEAKRAEQRGAHLRSGESVHGWTGSERGDELGFQAERGALPTPAAVETKPTKPLTFSARMALAAHQKRVVAERKELNDKLKKLKLFVRSVKFDLDVAPREQARLRRQLEAMESYHAILSERIEAF